MSFTFGKIALAAWVSDATDWITRHFADGFNVIQKVGTGLMNTITGALTAVPFWLMILVITLFAFLVSKKKIGFPLFTFLGLSLIAN